MPDITNAQVDALAGAVAAPYGPLVRVTNMDDLPVPNDNIKLNFTTAVAGVEVDMTYNELNDADVQAAVIAQAFAPMYNLQAFKVALGTFNTTVQAFALPHTYDDELVARNGMITLNQLLGIYNA